MPTFACDVSQFQRPVSDAYPHQWLIFRSNDGTYRDPNFAVNLAWAKRACAAGKMTGYTVYCVYRPSSDVFGTLTSMVGQPDKHVTVMVDVESWGGAIRGDHSADITRLIYRLGSWLGDPHRVIAYGNQGDLATIYPHRPAGLRLMVASYGTQQPNVPGLIGWQYSDGGTGWPVPTGYPRSSSPFGPCDHNVFPGLTPTQLADALGVGTPKGFRMDAEAKARFDAIEAKVDRLAKFIDVVFTDEGYRRTLASLLNRRVRGRKYVTTRVVK